MRCLLSGGGTGGHVYPALAAVEELKKSCAQRGEPIELLYAGTEAGLERQIVERAGIPFVTVRAAGIRGLSAGRALINLGALILGTWDARKIVNSFRPDVLLATGGYASAPLVVAARLQRCPVLIYLPDVEPGLAVTVLSRIAERVAISFDQSRKYFAPGKSVVTGYPVRGALFDVDRAASRSRMGLAAEGRVILVLGGSRGAHSINQAVVEGLEEMLELAEVVHITGQQDLSWVQSHLAALPALLATRYHVYGYLHDEMIDALRAADLAVARAGAATMGEFAAVGLPSILVPYPFSGQHQEANASFMVSQGASVRLGDGTLADSLIPTVLRLLRDPDALGSMSQHARGVAVPGAAAALANELVQLTGGD